MLDDMWLIHEDGTHFDLIIKKASVLANKDGIFHDSEDRSVHDKDSKEEEEEEEIVGPGYMGWEIKENEKKNLTEEEDEELKLGYQELRKDVRSMDRKMEELNKD